VIVVFELIAQHDHEPNLFDLGGVALHHFPNLRRLSVMPWSFAALDQESAKRIQGPTSA
jgi:hypothetical protein